jgi:DNA polymerase-3 subunit alpha
MTTGTETGFINVQEMDEHERLRAEKETLGFYLQGHPISRYEPELEQITTTTLSAVSQGVVRIAGYIESIRTRSGQRGRMAELRIDDRTARMHVNLYSEVYEKYRAILQKDKLVVISGEAVADEYYESGLSVKADKIADLADFRSNCGYLVLRLDHQMMQNGISGLLKSTLKCESGRKCQVVVEYSTGKAKGNLTLGNEWRVDISDNLLQQLGALIGTENVIVRYRDIHRYFAPTSKPKLKFISGSY